MVYSPRERLAPGMIAKNSNKANAFNPAAFGSGVNKLEPSAHQKEIELVVNSARTNQHHKKNASQGEISNIKTGSHQKKPPIDSVSPVQSSSKDIDEGKSR